MGAGGVLLETGAGGSAPKHVEQLLKENHLRWDSLGEYLATAIGFQELGVRAKDDKATLLGDTLMNAVGKWLDNNKAPGRKVKQIDNRGSNLRGTLLGGGVGCQGRLVGTAGQGFEG